jgi:pimeloyl-ACP methyl ester carboxylesterase
MKTLFRSERAKEKILKLYQDKLDELSISYESMIIETSFGDTHLIVTGPAEKPPLVLLHGANGCAPVAIESLKGLITHFRIYAIDVLGQPNLSAEARMSMKDDSYGQWMYELLTRLNLPLVNLAGISLGGLIALKALSFDERHFKRVFLIVPAGLVNSSPLLAMRTVFLPMKLYCWRKKPAYLQRFLKGLFSEEDPFARRFLAEVLLHFNMDFSPIPTIRKEVAAQIKTPIHIIAAEKDVLFPGEKMLRRAREIFPSMKASILLKQARHVPGAKDNERIMQLILEHKDAAEKRTNSHDH